MKVLIHYLKERGVSLQPNEQAIAFEFHKGQITKVRSSQHTYDADAVVIATGSWSREIAALAGIRIPLMPGRGYSVTLEDSPYVVHHPAILAEGRVAITPMDGNKIRFGGTMEVVPTSTPPQYNRVEGILKSVKNFFPEFDIPVPPNNQIWYGYRPCSADGLPYIGRANKYPNLIIATGHSMMGLSLGAGTGKLVKELINEETPSINLGAFSIERFG